jgi:Na+-translocating ferredoxin:NAD+ oxidoreductase RnfG subunit
MFRTALPLTWLSSIAVGLAILVIVSGCANPTATEVVQMETVHEIFPSATEISEISTSRTSEHPGDHRISEIRDSSGLLGYCIESEPVGRSGPFTIRVFLDRQLVVKRTVVTSYPWSHGRDVRKRAFTTQFDGKGPKDAIELGKDTDAMTGATISCRAMTESVHDAIKILKLIKSSKFQ